MFKAYGFDYTDKMSIKYDTDIQEGLFTVYKNEIDYDTNFEFRLTKSEVSFKIDKIYKSFEDSLNIDGFYESLDTENDIVFNCNYTLDNTNFNSIIDTFRYYASPKQGVFNIRKSYDNLTDTVELYKSIENEDEFNEYLLWIKLIYIAIKRNEEIAGNDVLDKIFNSSKIEFYISSRYDIDCGNIDINEVNKLVNF